MRLKHFMPESFLFSFYFHFQAHEAGQVKLQVALDYTVISNPVMFEFKMIAEDASRRLAEIDDLLLTTNLEDKEENSSELLNDQNGSSMNLQPAEAESNSSHNLYLCNDVSCRRILKTMLLQKLDDLKTYIVEDKSTPKASLTILRASTFFEDYLITLVKYLSQKKWNISATTTADENASNSLETNALYLATALNLPGLVHLLFQWADSNPNPMLNKDVDCGAQDPTGFTPLVMD